MAKRDQKLEELNKFLQKSGKEDTNKIYYILDYILNYKYGYRVSSELRYIGLDYLVNELIKIKIIKEVKEVDYRKNVTDTYLLYNDVKKDIKNMLDLKYNSKFKEKIIKETLIKLIKSNFSQALHIYSKIKEYETKSIPLEQNDLAIEIAKERFGYFVSYTSSSGNFMGYELIFKSIPLNIQNIFFDIVFEELQNRITEFNPSKRWVIYLKSLNPNANLNFYLTNKYNFSPTEIENAFSSIQGFKLTDDIIKDLLPSIIIDIENILTQELNFLIRKDLKYSGVFSSLLNIGYYDSNLKLTRISKLSFDNFINLISEPARVIGFLNLFLHKMVCHH